MKNCGMFVDLHSSYRNFYAAWGNRRKSTQFVEDSDIREFAQRFCQGSRIVSVPLLGQIVSNGFARLARDPE